MNWETIWQEISSLATSIAGKLLGAVLTLVIGIILVRMLLRALRKGKLFRRADTTIATFLFSFLKITLYSLVIITAVAILGVPMSSVIAVIASAGVAVGLALQGALSNLAGGIMILIFKPFRIGNYIDVDGHAGTVRNITIFYTILSTSDNKEITIPNGTIMSTTIVNVSAHETRRVDLEFGVAYGTDVTRVRNLLLEEAEQHELVLKDPAPFCRLTNQGDSSLDFTLRVWTKNSNYWQVRYDLLENINNRFLKEQIDIPYPQMDIHVTHTEESK